MDKHDKEILQLATLAGRLLIESEAEGYRVERTVKQILSLSSGHQTEVYSSASGLFLALNDHQLDTDYANGSTVILRVSKRQNHLKKIDKVNQVITKLKENTLTISQAKQQLLALKDQEYSIHQQFVWTLLMIISYVILLRGGPGDLVIALIPTLLILFFKLSDDEFGLNHFAVNVLMTTSLSFILPLIKVNVTDNFNTDIVIGATLMPLYPGTAFTNAIRDLMHMDYSTGLTRLVDAIVEALSLALGIGIGLALSYGVINLCK